MKYPLLQALVPQGEHFDESAILNEGGYLSIAHLSAIENDLATSATALEQANSMIESNTAVVGDLNEQITTLQTERDTATQTVNTHAARIVELEAQIVELGKLESGRGTHVPGGDDNHDPKPVPSYLDDNNPLNQWADKRMKKK